MFNLFLWGQNYRFFFLASSLIRAIFLGSILQLLILYLVQLATAKAQVLYLEKATVDEYALQSLDDFRKALTTAFCFHW